MNGLVTRWRALHASARWYLVHVALLTLSQTSVGLFFNVAILAYGHQRAELGQLNLVAIWASVVFSLPLWWLVTRLGFRRALLIHGACQALAIAVYAAAAPLPVLFGAAGIAGAASVLFQVSAPPLMMRYSDGDTRDMLFSASTGVTIIVAGIGSLLAGAMPAVFGRMLGVGAESGAAYQATFAVAALGMLLALLPLLAMANDARSQEPGARIQSSKFKIQNVKSIIQNLKLKTLLPVLALLISPACVSVGAALLIPYLNLFFKQQFGVPNALLGAIFALLDISTGVAVLLGPLLSARWGKLPTVVLTQLLSIPFLLVMGFSPLLGVAVGAAALRSALFNLGRPLYDAFAMERTAEAARPMVIGLMGGAATVGYLFMPAVSVYVQANYGFGPLFLATAACYALSTVVIVILFMLPARLARAEWYNSADNQGSKEDF